jgi:hypothetical protein
MIRIGHWTLTQLYHLLEQVKKLLSTIQKHRKQPAAAATSLHKLRRDFVITAVTELQLYPACFCNILSLTRIVLLYVMQLQ